MSSPPNQSTRHVWSKSDGFVPRRFLQPAMSFMQWEAAGGVALFVGALIAFIWANSPWSQGYEALLSTPVRIEIGSLPFHHLEELDLHAVINDALMALFFFVVALEIKRELVLGELRDRRAAALPVIAAVGGMVVPAAIYLAFNAGSAGSNGWGIPMATDIAFAVGVISLVPGVPTGARLFLLTLAVVDDLGAIAVIAVAYTSDLRLDWLAGGLVMIALTVFVTRLHIRSAAPYLVLGVGLWLCLLESGVHATLAGVAMGFLAPSWSFYDPARFAEHARPLVDEVEQFSRGDLNAHGDHGRYDHGLDTLINLATESRSPLDRHVRKLVPWTAFVVVPIFAFANAGVRIPSASALGEPVVLGVGVGLVVGKVVGVFGATWIALKLRVGVLPSGVNLRHLLGVGLCAGIGFTVALFVATLSFPTDQVLTDEARLGILAGSLVSGLLGYFYLRLAASTEVGVGSDDEGALPALVAEHH